MINVNKNQNNIPASLTNAFANENYSLVVDTVQANHKKNISGVIYRAADVVTRLKNLYHDKCAFCEGKKYDPEVEHFRPKKQIDGVARELHPGYYWLCYEWSNLLPSCHDCNKTGAKGNHFPINGIRVNNPTLLAGGAVDIAQNLYTSAPLSGEIPLLLHPEENGFDPFHFFYFTANGEMKESQPLNTLDFERASNTIKKIKLNRDDLVLNERKREINYYGKRLKLSLLRLLGREITAKEFERNIQDILSEIRSKTRRTHEYSFFWNYFYKHFNRFIEEYIKPKYRNKIFEITSLYIRQNPA